jgi:hypothetical protein
MNVWKSSEAYPLGAGEACSNHSDERLDKTLPERSLLPSNIRVDRSDYQLA